MREYNIPESSTVCFGSRSVFLLNGITLVWYSYYNFRSVQPVT
uniref:Uncharacterized protein n=1 Tax=Heterorhabditis bacteriophora TaxID=37862 RepID=A0A1I7WR95_HETBA